MINFVSLTVIYVYKSLSLLSLTYGMLEIIMHLGLLMNSVEKCEILSLSCCLNLTGSSKMFIFIQVFFDASCTLICADYRAVMLLRRAGCLIV